MKKILLIDDEPSLIELLKMRLEGSGYEVESAGNGVEGLKKIKEHVPDLIILDVSMPEMDGFTFLTEMKSMNEFRDIPVIVLTAKEQMEDLFKQERVAGFVTKPFNAEELLSKVKEICGS